ncbi:hypothetical protein K431DRAFT_119501 [Polychaeton citri CBS 116435]|uniref:Uncharacterized protein n=1 Tax=Polychaeton citri CBS 116435 TaxID=1314669 RepID=A0A9P4Q6E6_9PEZI|nr:hypothetical protein K431DRAFT_119501 [Polychaeton citri CBS 116435]
MKSAKARARWTLQSGSSMVAVAATVRGTGNAPVLVTAPVCLMPQRPLPQRPLVLELVMMMLLPCSRVQAREVVTARGDRDRMVGLVRRTEAEDAALEDPAVRFIVLCDTRFQASRVSSQPVVVGIRFLCFGVCVCVCVCPSSVSPNLFWRSPGAEAPDVRRVLDNVWVLGWYVEGDVVSPPLYEEGERLARPEAAARRRCLYRQDSVSGCAVVGATAQARFKGGWYWQRDQPDTQVADSIQ